MLLCLPATSRQRKGAKTNIFEALTLDAYGQVIIHVTKLWLIFVVRISSSAVSAVQAISAGVKAWANG